MPGGGLPLPRAFDYRRVNARRKKARRLPLESDGVKYFARYRNFRAAAKVVNMVYTLRCVSIELSTLYKITREMPMANGRNASRRC